MILSILESQNSFHNKDVLDMNYVEEKLNEDMQAKWIALLPSKPKLRTYAKFKTKFSAEHYVKGIISKRQRSLIAQLRIGILPLHTETGRIRGIPHEERLCYLCNEQIVEDEQHFVIKCKAFQDERRVLFNNVKEKCTGFANFSDVEKFIYIVSNEWKALSKCLDKSWSRCSRHLYM